MTSLHPKKWNFHVDTGRRKNANIKGKENQWGGGGDQEVCKKKKEKNINLLGRGLKTETTQATLEEGFARKAEFILIQISVETITNHCPETEA